MQGAPGLLFLFLFSHLILMIPILLSTARSGHVCRALSNIFRHLEFQFNQDSSIEVHIHEVCNGLELVKIHAVSRHSLPDPIKVATSIPNTNKKEHQGHISAVNVLTFSRISAASRNPSSSFANSASRTALPDHRRNSASRIRYQKSTA